MKAWVLHAINDIRYEELCRPEPKPDEVLVEVKAAGICGSDVPRVYETGAHNMPLTPGHEFSGLVRETGEGADPALKGKRVGIYPLIPCGKCRPCREGHPETCRSYDYLGSRRDGGFAEYVAVPVDNLIELPDSVSFEEAAMLEPMAVAVHAMKMGIGKDGDALKQDAKIAVCGLGTIGLLLTMFIKASGYANVFVIGNKDSQRERAASFGIGDGYFCDSRTMDPAAWLNGSVGGVDAYFECVGKNESLSYGINGTGPGGHIVFLGNPYSDMALDRDTYWKILRNQLTIRGSWNSAFYPKGSNSNRADDWSYVLGELKDKKLSPSSLISHRLGFDELEKGLMLMREKREERCKVMLVRQG